MFKIQLSPQSSLVDDTPPTVAGDVLTYRGESYDLGPLPEGCDIDIGAPFIGSIARKNGEISVMLEYRYTTVTAEPYQPTDMQAYTFVVADGVCPCPIIRRASTPEIALQMTPEEDEHHG